MNNLNSLWPKIWGDFSHHRHEFVWDRLDEYFSPECVCGEKARSYKSKYTGLRIVRGGTALSVSGRFGADDLRVWRFSYMFTRIGLNHFWEKPRMFSIQGKMINHSHWRRKFLTDCNACQTYSLECDTIF